MIRLSSIRKCVHPPYTAGRWHGASLAGEAEGLGLEVENNRTDIQRSLAHSNAGDRKGIRSRFGDECEWIYKAIRAVNIGAPASSLQLMALNCEREWAQALQSRETKKDQSQDWS